MKTVAEQHLVGANGVQALTVPASATLSRLTADGGDVRYSFTAANVTGGVTPSSTVGTPIIDGKYDYVWEASGLSAYIPTGCTLHVAHIKEQN